MLHPPDLVIYLRASVPTLQRRIAMRGREFESTIDPQYLQQLNDFYEQWLEGFSLCPVLTVPTDEMDFVAHNGHMELIAQKMTAKLMGKEEVVFTPRRGAQLHGLMPAARLGRMLFEKNAAHSAAFSFVSCEDSLGSGLASGGGVPRDSTTSFTAVRTLPSISTSENSGAQIMS